MLVNWVFVPRANCFQILRRIEEADENVCDTRIIIWVTAQAVHSHRGYLVPSKVNPGNSVWLDGEARSHDLEILLGGFLEPSKGAEFATAGSVPDRSSEFTRLGKGGKGSQGEVFRRLGCTSVVVHGDPCRDRILDFREKRGAVYLDTRLGEK
jgi:hypothetical protein